LNLEENSIKVFLVPFKVNVYTLRDQSMYITYMIMF